MKPRTRLVRHAYPPTRYNMSLPMLSLNIISVWESGAMSVVRVCVWSHIVVWDTPAVQKCYQAEQISDGKPWISVLRYAYNLKSRRRR
jgi:hypothetical protein